MVLYAENISHLSYFIISFGFSEGCIMRERDLIFTKAAQT